MRRFPWTTSPALSLGTLAQRQRHERTAVKLHAGILGTARIAIGHEQAQIALGIVQGTILHGGFAVVPPAAAVVRDAVGYGKAERRRVQGETRREGGRGGREG